MTIPRQIWIGLTAAVLLTAPATAADVKNGKQLAEAHCSRCHVVGDYNKFGGIGSTPSFQGIRFLKDWRERFA